MQGDIIRKKLLSEGYVLRNIATSMGETPQNLDMLLRAKDVKTGTLERICKVINRSIDFFYSDEEYQYLLPGFTHDDDHLAELKHAAFEALLLNPGSGLDTWSRRLLDDYPAEVADAYGCVPEVVEAALANLWLASYKDRASRLEYSFSTWASCFCNGAAVQMYYDMIDKLKM